MSTKKVIFFHFFGNFFKKRVIFRKNMFFKQKRHNSPEMKIF